MNTKVLRLTTPDDLLEGIPQHVAEDGQGRIYVVQQGSNAPILVFDRQGSFLRTLGRRGSGPGEFQSAGFLVPGLGDSVAVWDYGLSRLTVLTVSGGMVRSFSVPIDAISALWQPKGQGFVFNGHMGTPDRIGYAFHRTDGIGRLSRSFGDVEEPITFNEVSPIARRIVGTGPNSFVAVSINSRFKVERWEGDVLTQVWLRDSPLFGGRGSAPERFPARVNGLQVLPQAKAVVLLTVQDPNWQRGVRPKRLPDGEETIEFLDVDLVFDTVIEVIDLVRGRVVARGRFDQAWFWLLGSGRLVRYLEDPELGPVMEVATFSYTSP